jgi:putative cardiolipin synthase
MLVGATNSGLALVSIALSLTLGACTGVPSHAADKDASYAEKDLEATPLGSLAQELSGGKEASKSGFLLLDRGHDALAWRLFMAANAVRTLDAQYFLWKNDRAGRLFIQRLMDAAERGVRVRVLIDDSMTESDPLYLARFGAHPNIEVRLYKPFGPKHKSYVFRWIDFAADFKLLNRRMHNKLYIADGSFVISGGRNIGEDYFEYLAPDVFRSRDLMGVGPLAHEASTAFFSPGREISLRATRRDTATSAASREPARSSPASCSGAIRGWYSTRCPARTGSRRCRRTSETWLERRFEDWPRAPPSRSSSRARTSC